MMKKLIIRTILTVIAAAILLTVGYRIGHKRASNCSDKGFELLSRLTYSARMKDLQLHATVINKLPEDPTIGQFAHQFYRVASLAAYTLKSEQLWSPYSLPDPQPALQEWQKAKIRLEEVMRAEDIEFYDWFAVADRTRTPVLGSDTLKAQLTPEEWKKTKERFEKVMQAEGTDLTRPPSPDDMVPGPGSLDPKPLPNQEDK